MLFVYFTFACQSPVVQEEAGEKNLPGREEVGPFHIVRLSGTPYEMGFQHGELMEEELGEAAAYISTDPTMMALFTLAEMNGLLDLALTLSDPWVLDECRGITDGAEGSGWTLDHCLLLSFGDVAIERLRNPPLAPPGCSQIVLHPNATENGRLLHGRLLDWDEIDFILEHPTLLVRSPDDGIPHVVIGFPGNVAPYQGMNTAGMVLASNEAYPLDVPIALPAGRSHVQLQGALLSQVRTVEEVRTAVQNTVHMATTTIVASSSQGEALVAEMHFDGFDIREISGEMLIQTNHFVGTNTLDLDESPDGANTEGRWARIQFLLEDDDAPVPRTKEGIQQILRDRVNHWSGEVSEAGVFDDSLSIATNGALYGVLFDPEWLHFYVAAGEIPVPQQTWMGFSLLDLLGKDDPHLGDLMDLE